MEKISPAQMRGKDLLSQLPKAPFLTAPKHLIKSIILDAVIVAFAVITGVLFASYLAGEKPFVWPLVSAGVFMAISVLGSLLTKNLWHRFAVIALESVGFLLPFIGAPLNLLGTSFAVMIILLVWGEYLSREDAENSVEIRFFRVIRRPLSKMLTAIAIVAVILYIPVWNKKTIFVSESTFSSIYGWSVKFAQGLYPEYRLDSDLGAFAKSVAKSQLERNINFSLLPTAIKEKTLGDLSEQVMGNLSKFFGFSLDAKNTFGDAILAFANKSLTDLKGKFGATFVTVWAIAVFVFVRGLATLFGYLVSFVSFLVYHALIAFGVIRVKTENKPHEIVEFF